jgi:hypothetical protein
MSGTTYNPSVPMGDLVFAIDAANPKCQFISGSSNCKNIITGGNVSGASGAPGTGAHTASAANFPAFNASYPGAKTPVFDFNSGRGMNIDEDLGASNGGLTLSMWLYKNSTSTQYFTDGRNNGGQYFLSNYQDENINFTNRLGYNFDATYDSGAPEFINRWIHLCVTSGGAGHLIYLNGYEITANPYGYRNSYVYQNSIDLDLGRNYRIGTRYTTSTEWTGAMGPIHIWKRQLNSAEVLQTFNAHKNRFDLVVV